MTLVKKKKELCYEKIISREKEENQRKFIPLMFDLNEKQKPIFIYLLNLVYKWFLYHGKKKT